MSNRLENHRLTTLEQQAYSEACEHFAQQLSQFSAAIKAIEHLERDLAKIAVAANIAAARTPSGNTILTDNAHPWHKAVDLMDNIHLCHRKGTDGPEYAIVEYKSELGRNEVRHRGRNVIGLLQQFGQEQRRALDVWSLDMDIPLKEFLAQKYPGQDLSRMASTFMLRFSRRVLVMPTQSREGNDSQRIRI